MGQSGQSNRASRKRNTFRGRKGDNAHFLARSAYAGMLSAEKRRQRLLGALGA